MCVVHWRGIHGGNVCALTVHVHSQSEGGRPYNIACCNLVLPTVTASDVSNSQTCSGDSDPCVSDGCTTPGQIDVWRWVGTELEGEGKLFTFSRCSHGRGRTEVRADWRRERLPVSVALHQCLLHCMATK